MFDIVWDNKYLIGVERIDHEHQVFFDLIRNVARASHQEMPRTRVLRLLTALRKYADFHFCSEENLMFDSEYPHYVGHKKEHEMLLSYFDDQFQQYRLGGGDLTKLLEFLVDWFILHTTKTDRTVAEFLNSDKLSTAA